MAEFSCRKSSDLEETLWRLYRSFFDKAERKRRWSIEGDIPWSQCNRSLAPEIADVVESFCAVELYLPDYLMKAFPSSRPSRARSWFYANWGYEESKHSLALGDWLVRSGMRTEEQLTDLEALVFTDVWQITHEHHVALLAYAMVQERATGLNYRNLRRCAQERGGDPALEQLLMYVAVDEQAHYTFFQDAIGLYLKHDRAATIEHLRQVMNAFAMPAIYALVGGRQRVAKIKEMEIFNDNLYYQEVYLPILEALGVSRAEMRNRVPTKKSATIVSGV